MIRSLLILFLAARASAAPGATSENFLRIVTSPRAVGMGESGVALSDDLLSAASLNPAGLGRLAYAEAAATYNLFYQGLSLQEGAFALPTLSYGTFGVHGKSFGSSAIPGYDNFGAQSSDVNVREYAASAAYARKLGGYAREKSLGLFAGASLTYARSTLDTVSANSVLADVGLLFVGRLGPGTWSVGASGLSLGQGPRYDVQRELAPTVYRAGLAYSLPVLGDPMTATVDIKKPSDEKNSYGVGLEYGVKNIIFWRAGYSSDQSLGSGFRFGAGFKLKVFSVDYALSDYGNFGLTHLMGLSVKFGEPIESTPVLSAGEREAIQRVKRGKTLLRNGRPYDAALEFNEALRLDSHNADAILGLRQAKETLERQK